MLASIINGISIHSIRPCLQAQELFSFYSYMLYIIQGCIAKHDIEGSAPDHNRAIRALINVSW